MIKVVTGKLGAGKTLYCVSEIMELLRSGRVVCSNILLDEAHIARVLAQTYGLRMRPKQLRFLDVEATPDWHKEIPFGSRAEPVAVYLDEIHLFFNARDWAETDKSRRGLLSFLTQSRKAGVDVTFIAQEITTVEKQFRALAEYEYYIQPLSHVALGWLGSLPINGFLVIVKDAYNGTFQKRLWRTYKKAFFGCYDTCAMLDSRMRDLTAAAEKVSSPPLACVGRWERFKLWWNCKKYQKK
jgi:hypothetical protein